VYSSRIVQLAKRRRCRLGLAPPSAKTDGDAVPPHANPNISVTQLEDCLLGPGRPACARPSYPGKGAGMLMKWRSMRGESKRCPDCGSRRRFRPRLETLEDRLTPANIVWSGAAADANFTNDAKWVGNVAPGVNDTAIFDPSQSGGAVNANKNATINAPVNVQALLLQGTYTG